MSTLGSKSISTAVLFSPSQHHQDYENLKNEDFSHMITSKNKNNVERQSEKIYTRERGKKVDKDTKATVTGGQKLMEKAL
jgi:hypothetical protein